MNESSLLLFVKVTTRSLKNEVVFFQDDTMHIRIKALAEKGKGNKSLCVFLSELFEIPQSQVEILSGSASRHKKVRLSGVSSKKIEELKQKFREKSLPKSL